MKQVIASANKGETISSAEIPNNSNLAIKDTYGKYIGIAYKSNLSGRWCSHTNPGTASAYTINGKTLDDLIIQLASCGYKVYTID